MINLEDLFSLYINNTNLQTERSAAELVSCYYKYKNSLPKNYIYDFPDSVILKLTEACNLRCKHCFYANQPGFYNKNSELTTNEILELVDFLADEINILSITLTGGEVFIRKDFFEILKHIKQKYLPVIIQTNGILVDEVKAQQLGEVLNYKTDSVQISLEGADSKSHDEIRGSGTFEKTINAIKLLRQNSVRVRINMTLTTVSAPKMDSIFELCDDLNITNLSIGRYEVCSEQQQYLELTADDLMKYSYIILTKSANFKEIKMNYRH